MPGQAASAPVVATRMLREQSGETPAAFSQYAIVGKYADGGPPNFVQHVALLREGGPVVAKEEVNVLHMGPPLVAGDQARTTNPTERKCRTDLVADLVLDAEERESIADWLSHVESEDVNHPWNPVEQYIVVPHFKWETARETGRRIRRRFSCAGFVIEAYRHANIRLIDADGELPDVREDLLRAAYPNVDLSRHDRVRAKWGLGGSGPWKVILAGYLFHSTVRATPASPRPPAYLPQSAAEGSFPLPALASGASDVMPAVPQ
jgi:hypothetical protein